MKQITSFIIVTSLIATISGCGGGGGDSTSSISTATHTSSVTSSDVETGQLIDVPASDLESFKLTAPANDAIVFQQRKLVVSIGNNSTTERVDYWADNKTIFLGSSDQAPFSHDFDTTLLANGQHKIQAYAYDMLGTQLASQEVTVISFADSFKNAQEFHVSPIGTPSGNGSINLPWDAETMFNSSAISPGDIVWMHGGNYDNSTETNVYLTRLHGTKEKPILIRAYGDGPVDIHIKDGIDGYGVHTSSWNWFWGFEPHISRPERSVPDTGYRRLAAFYLTNQGHRIINCVAYDNGHPGIGNWSAVGDTGEVYGTLIWGTGIYDFSPTIRGSAIYAQNEVGTRYFRDNITFRNFTNGIKPYAENGYVNGFHLEGNIAFKNYLAPISLESGTNPMQNTKLINNYTFDDSDDTRKAVTVGKASEGTYNNGLELIGNYFVAGVTSQTGALDISMFNNMTVSNNTIITKHTLNNSEKPRLFTFRPTPTQSNVSWNNNNYFGGRDTSLGNDNIINNYVNWNTRDYLTSVDQWKSLRTPFDIDSTWTRSYPQENSIFVRPNLYERGRGHIVIYNWEIKSNVNVNISDLGLNEGEAFEIRDAQNFYGAPVLTANYSESKSIVQLPMNLTQISPTIGDVHHMDKSLSHTSNRFATFVVLKK
ncbi:MAG: hypothetical protein COA44_00575 [Arcobacter sp.]|nr:MAG: hypothetical protein COA44_00575 [Arcobacter sp.]